MPAPDFQNRAVVVPSRLREINDNGECRYEERPALGHQTEGFGAEIRAVLDAANARQDRGTAPGGQPVSDETKPAKKPSKPSRPAKPAVEPSGPVAAPEEVKPAPVVMRTMPVVRDATVPRAPGLPTPEEQAARATLAEIEKMARRLDLLSLTERTCKWPIGDPTEESFHFCGLPSATGKPYCEHHVAVAFQPMSTRRDRARAGR